MYLTLHFRVRGGWEAREYTVAPGTVLWARQTFDEAFQTADPKCNCPQPNPGDKCRFHAVPIGGWAYGKASGTCTELAHAGICVACLSRDPDCKFCDGSGRVPTDTPVGPPLAIGPPIPK